MLDWVQDKIRHARAEGWTRLDLGNTGLTTIPEEVWSLEELEVLVLGSRYYDHPHRTWVASENQGPQNTIAVIPEQMARLSRLCELYLNGNEIVDVEPLVALTALISLDLSYTQVQDVKPLADLAGVSLGPTAAASLCAGLAGRHGACRRRAVGLPVRRQRNRPAP